MPAWARIRSSRVHPCPPEACPSVRKLNQPTPSRALPAGTGPDPRREILGTLDPACLGTSRATSRVNYSANRMSPLDSYGNQGAMPRVQGPAHPLSPALASPASSCSGRVGGCHTQARENHTCGTDPSPSRRRPQLGWTCPSQRCRATVNQGSSPAAGRGVSLPVYPLQHPPGVPPFPLSPCPPATA